MPNSREEHFHWGWIVASAALGIAFITVAHLGALAWGWPEVTTGTIASFGAAFILAFVLFVFERRFIRGVAREVRDVTESVIMERTENFGSRLDDLEHRLNARRDQDEAERGASVDSIANDVSFASISDALENADEVGAINDGRLTVPGAAEEPNCATTFRYGSSYSVRGDGFVLDDGTTERLLVTVDTVQRDGEFGRPRIETEWTPDMSAEDVGSDLEIQLRRRGRLTEAKTFSFPHAVRELQRGLSTALQDQRVPAGEEVLHGALWEVIDADWAITSMGLENVRSGYQFPWDEMSPRPRSQTPRRAPTAPRPDDVAPGFWTYVLSRVEEQRPRSDALRFF